jgi:hypothetical protein
MTMNWHDTINDAQNRTQWRNLIYKAVEDTKRLRDSKTLYLLLRKSNGITRGRLRPEGTSTTIKEPGTVQYSFKNMSCKEFHTYIRGVPVLLRKIGSTEKYALAPRIATPKFRVTFCLFVFLCTLEENKMPSFYSR